MPQGNQKEGAMPTTHTIDPDTFNAGDYSPVYSNPESGNGGVYGKPDMGLFRVMMILSGLSMEIRTGMKLTRGPKCSTIVRREYGFKGRPPKLLQQVVQYHLDRGEIVHNPK
jgi:hypothetical protein